MPMPRETKGRFYCLFAPDGNGDLTNDGISQNVSASLGEFPCPGSFYRIVASLDNEKAAPKGGLYGKKETTRGAAWNSFYVSVRNSS